MHCAVRSSAITTSMLAVVLGCCRRNSVGRAIATITNDPNIKHRRRFKDGFQRKLPTAKPQPEAQASGGPGGDMVTWAHA